VNVPEACEQLRALAAALKAEAMTLEEWADQVAAVVEELDPRASGLRSVPPDALPTRFRATRSHTVDGSPLRVDGLRPKGQSAPADVPA